MFWRVMQFILIFSTIDIWSVTSHFADNGSKLSNELIKALFLLTHDNVENALTFIKSSETKQNYLLYAVSINSF